MSAIPWFPFQILRRPFISNYLNYIGLSSVVTQKKIRHFAKRFYNNIDIKFFFSSFEVGNRFGMKDPIPRGLRTCEVHKFLYAGCNACYVGETSRHLSTRVREHLVSYRTSHSFRHLPNSQQCCILCSDECFSILDHASATLPLKIKEAIHS